MTAPKVDGMVWPPRGLSRDEAAYYVGVGIKKFDQLVSERRMPKPKRIDGRVVWDRIKLDIAFADLPDDEEENPIDKLLQGGHRQR